MDVGTLNGWQADQVVSSKVLLDRIAGRWPVEALQSNYRGEVAKRYAFTDGKGEIGFISSVSEPFCGDCHRARLSAEGTLYTCLFANHGTDLRGALRAGASDADLVGLAAERLAQPDGPLQRACAGRRSRVSSASRCTGWEG